MDENTNNNSLIIEIKARELYNDFLNLENQFLRFLLLFGGNRDESSSEPSLEEIPF